MTGLNEMAKFEHPESGRQITFIGMSHIETVRYYNEIKDYLDSLRRDGYKVFFEMVMSLPPNEPITDTAALMTAHKKYRRLFGRIHTTYEGFESVAKHKGDRPGQLVQQTEDRIGVSFENDEWCDLTIPELVDGYEAEYGEIVLTECDLSTPFMAKYKCRTKQKFNTHYAYNGLRHDYILKKVVESEHQKIVMVYGSMHLFMMRFDLEKYGFVCTDWLISEAKKPNKFKRALFGGS